MIVETYLLKEDGGYLLKEDGGKIVLTRTTVASTAEISHVTLDAGVDLRNKSRERPKQILKLTSEIQVFGTKIVLKHTKIETAGLVKKSKSTQIPFETILSVTKRTAIPIEPTITLHKQRTLCSVTGVKKPDTVSREIVTVAEALKGIHKIMAKQDKINTLKRLLEKVSEE